MVTTLCSCERGKILVQRSGIKNGSIATILASSGLRAIMLTLPAPAQTFGLVSSVYATGRALMPAPLAGVAGSLEHRVTELSLPVISIVQDQSERVRRHASNAGCILSGEPRLGILLNLSCCCSRRSHSTCDMHPQPERRSPCSLSQPSVALRPTLHSALIPCRIKYSCFVLHASV